ncbi:hypothetical protein C7435_0383 [Maricaulis maris]|uniref:Uncharacterized protein n=1 Tax=Maricaulis maris TaxID=74318 RepID=A0A495DMR6_9PROT|nr:hypothetical protein C7435_0383 [Maricaulis maris]
MQGIGVPLFSTRQFRFASSHQLGCLMVATHEYDNEAALRKLCQLAHEIASMQQK